MFIPVDMAPQYTEWVAFAGTSVTIKGKQKYLDGRLTYQRACLYAIEYVTTFRYSPEQAYLLLEAAPIEGHLSSVMDIPNTCATVSIPTVIFDFDIKPNNSGPHRVEPGSVLHGQTPPGYQRRGFCVPFRKRNAR